MQNGNWALVHVMRNCTERTGVSLEKIMISYIPVSYTHLLTGPVERGDKNTVQKHMDALDADMKNAYLENAKRCV